MTVKKMKVCFLAFYDDRGHILLNHRKDGLKEDEDYWEIMGGSIEQGELPVEAIKREIKEELNYEVSEVKDNLSFVEQFQLSDRNIQFEVYYYKAIFPGLHELSDSDEVFISDLKTFSLEEALSLNLLPICRYILEWTKLRL